MCDAPSVRVSSWTNSPNPPRSPCSDGKTCYETLHPNCSWTTRYEQNLLSPRLLYCCAQAVWSDYVTRHDASNGQLLGSSASLDFNRLRASVQPDNSGRGGHWAIMTPFDLFKLSYMTFGLHYIARIFQRLVDEVHRDSIFVIRIWTPFSSHPQTKRCTWSIRTSCFNSSTTAHKSG